MTIAIPHSLQWVSELVGAQWIDADEDGLSHLGRLWHDFSRLLAGLIPDLEEVRVKTLEVLFGETAAAADQQFRMLFDGEYSVHKLVDATSTVGQLCDKTATSVEYAKISILFNLGKAAVEILYAYATASETWGASLEMIPITEAFTRYSIRQAVMNLLKQIFGQLDHALQKTLVKELLREGIEKLEWAAVKESTVQGIQIAEGHRHGFELSKFAKSLGVGFIGGAVNQGTKDVVKDGLKLTTQRVLTDEGKLGFREVDGPIEGAIKGAVSGYAGGTAASAAGTVISGGSLNPTTLFTSGIASAVKGGMQGSVKANNAERYDRGWYPAGKQASDPFTKSIGWDNPAMTGGLAVSSSAAGAAAWVSGHAPAGQSGASSPPPPIPTPHLLPMAVAIQGIKGIEGGPTDDPATATPLEGGAGP